VVFVGVPDPVGSGLASSLAAGNLTGLARAASRASLARRFRARELDPAVGRILWNPDAAIEEHRRQAIAAAGAFGITPVVIEVRDRDGIVAAFAAMRKEHKRAVRGHRPPDSQNRSEIVRLAAVNRIPAVYEFGEFVRAGGLVAYAPSVTEQFRRAAIYVDKILHGAKPGELPIEQPTKFELVINLKTAKALGITVPKEMLLRADEVIQ
jgi:putative ABC transport system substrate-binding protein